MFKGKGGDTPTDHKFYRNLYPQIIEDIEVGMQAWSKGSIEECLVKYFDIIEDIIFVFTLSENALLGYHLTCTQDYAWEPKFHFHLILKTFLLIYVSENKILGNKESQIYSILYNTQESVFSKFVSFYGSRLRITADNIDNIGLVYVSQLITFL